MAGPGAADLELVRRALRGERGAQHELALRLAGVPRMLASLDRRARVLGAEDRADLAQDVLVALWSRLREYDGAASLATWAFGFCDYVYRNRVRKLRRRGLAVRLDAQRLAGPGPDPADVARHERLHLGLARLPARDARVIELHCFHGRDFAEIGRHLGCPPGTAKTRYYRGLRRLAELLGSEDRSG